jgi:hypothetical protein
MGWPFSKTYRVKCKDGSVKTVYKNVGDAFPLCIPGWKGDLSAAGKVLDKANADLKAEYATAIHGLLYALDELNQGLMMTFRAAYVVYQNDPCEHAPFFEREVAKLLDEQRRLRALKVQIDGLIQLAKQKPEHSEEFARIMANVVDRFGTLLLPQATSKRIADARKLTKRMAEGRNDD